MTFAEVRAKFEQARDNRRHVASLRAEAESYRLMAQGSAIRYDKDHVQTSPKDYQSEYLIKAAELDQKADDLVRSGYYINAQLIKWLDVCKDDERIVLTYHYINNVTYREIEYECSEALGDKRYNTAHDIAQRGIQRIADMH
jgi:hypothetical protein